MTWQWYKIMIWYFQWHFNTENHDRILIGYDRHWSLLGSNTWSKMIGLFIRPKKHKARDLSFATQYTGTLLQETGTWDAFRLSQCQCGGGHWLESGRGTSRGCGFEVFSVDAFDATLVPSWLGVWMEIEETLIWQCVKTLYPWWTSK